MQHNAAPVLLDVLSPEPIPRVDVFDPETAIDREFAHIVQNYEQPADRPAGTMYGAARETPLTAEEQALITPRTAGALAIGIYSVGPVQSEAAEARIRQHEAWLTSEDRAIAHAQALYAQQQVDFATSLVRLMDSDSGIADEKPGAKSKRTKKDRKKGDVRLAA